VDSAAIVRALRADPGMWFAVAEVVHHGIASPWCEEGVGFVRYWPGGGLACTTHGRNGRRNLERIDAELTARGVVLVGGVPDWVFPSCGRAVYMMQGRPRLMRASDPRVKLECWEPIGHAGPCIALAPMIHAPGDRDHDPDRRVWWTEDRRA